MTYYKIELNNGVIEVLPFNEYNPHNKQYDHYYITFENVYMTILCDVRYATISNNN